MHRPDEFSAAQPSGARQAHFELIAGAAGDMLLGAALDAWAALEAPGAADNSLRLKPWLDRMHGFLHLESGARIDIQNVVRGGLAATKIDFYVGSTHADDFASSSDSHSHHHSHDHNHEHSSEHSPAAAAHAHASAAHSPHRHGRHLHEIEQILLGQCTAGFLSETAVTLALKIFSILAAAEAKVHGSTPERVHFHEVGEFDAIMDIAGFATIWTMLGCTQATASPVTLGSGTIKTQHGMFGVPAPAVVEIVRQFEMPVGDLVLPGECLTPTGAACLAAVVTGWTSTPRLSKILCQGVGAGTRECKDTPNVVRLLVGNS